MTLQHPSLDRIGVLHGFGTRVGPQPAGLLRPRQVHGARVASPDECRGGAAPEADAIVSSEPGVSVGVVTADCVPVLLAALDGACVGAVHAGWRGLAQGVVEAGVDALRSLGARKIVAVVGPHIGPCCYEVDAPVIDALRARHGGALDAALHPVRPGHGMLDLGALTERSLRAEGVEAARLADACTHCDAERFHSYRRDGPRAGRLVHFVAALDRQGTST